MGCVFSGVMTRKIVFEALESGWMSL